MSLTVQINNTFYDDIVEVGPSKHVDSPYRATLSYENVVANGKEAEITIEVREQYLTITVAVETANGSTERRHRNWTIQDLVDEFHGDEVA